MPLKINVGLQQKIGQPDYGSLGASCYLELEAESRLLENPAAFQQQVAGAFAACKEAVQAQLSAGGVPASGSATPGQNGNGHTPLANGQRTAPGKPVRRATQSQARAIRNIAQRAGVWLEQRLQERFGVATPEQLSLTEASSFIDELKAAGERRAA